MFISVLRELLLYLLNFFSYMKKTKFYSFLLQNFEKKLSLMLESYLIASNAYGIACRK